MHPILRYARRLGLYLFGLTPFPTLLTVLVLHFSLSWGQSVAIVLPLCSVYAFVCLTSLYSCRAFPLTSEHFVPNLGNHALHAVLGGFMWLLMAKLIGSAIGVSPDHLNAIIP